MGDFIGEDYIWVKKYFEEKGYEVKVTFNTFSKSEDRKLVTNCTIEDNTVSLIVSNFKF